MTRKDNQTQTEEDTQVKKTCQQEQGSEVLVKTATNKSDRRRLTPRIGGAERTGRPLVSGSLPSKDL